MCGHALLKLCMYLCVVYVSFKFIILYSQKFLPGENFHQFWHPLIGTILTMNFLSCVNYYIEDMATFTTLVKTYSIEYFFVQQKFLAIQ